MAKIVYPGNEILNTARTELSFVVTPHKRRSFLPEGRIIADDNNLSEE
jgi:hypothetical protein